MTGKFYARGAPTLPSIGLFCHFRGDSKTVRAERGLFLTEPPVDARQ